MSFAVSDFREWVHILYDHPEWRAELRRLVLTDEILGLPDRVRELTAAVQALTIGQQELAAAQKRTEQRVEELAESVHELSEAQKRTEQRVEELAESVHELSEAQKRTEQRVEELAEGQVRLGSVIGDLQRAFGATVEEEAASVVGVVLCRKGYRILQPAYPLALDGEIDVVLSLEDPSGEQVWAMVEAKARLSQRDVHAWSRRMHSADWHRRLAEKKVRGPYLVYAYSIRADLGAQEMAEKEGIGLLRSDGETLAPRGLIEPAD